MGLTLHQSLARDTVEWGRLVVFLAGKSRGYHTEDEADDDANGSSLPSKREAHLLDKGFLGGGLRTWWIQH